MRRTVNTAILKAIKTHFELSDEELNKVMVRFPVPPDHEISEAEFNRIAVLSPDQLRADPFIMHMPS